MAEDWLRSGSLSELLRLPILSLFAVEASTGVLYVDEDWTDGEAGFREPKPSSEEDVLDHFEAIFPDLPTFRPSAATNYVKAHENEAGAPDPHLSPAARLSHGGHCPLGGIKGGRHRSLGGRPFFNLQPTNHNLQPKPKPKPNKKGIKTCQLSIIHSGTTS